MKRTFCDICGEEITYQPSYSLNIKGESPFSVVRADEVYCDLCDDCRKELVGNIIALRSLRNSEKVAKK